MSNPAVVLAGYVVEVAVEKEEQGRVGLVGRLSLPRVATALLALFLALVWFRVHSWEAYMYAASAEGFFRMSEMFSAVYGDAPVPEISRFHPYHPLFHMLVEAILWAGRFVAGDSANLSALTIAVVVNKLSALAAAVLAFRILSRLLRDPLAAVIAVGGMVLTKAFLFGAFSGDAHVLSLALFLGTLDLVLRSDPSERSEVRRAALAAALFSVGVGMNLAIFFYGLLPLAVLLVGRRFKATAVAVGLSALLLFGLYVVTPVVLFDLKDLDAFTRLFSIYGYLPAPEGSLPVLALYFVDAVSAGLVGGIDALSAGARVLIGLLLVGGAVCLWRAPSSGTPRFWVAMWIGGFAIGELAMHTVKSVNGTIYVMLPLFALVGYLLRALRSRRVLFSLVVAALVAVGSVNVAKVVVSKALAGQVAAPRLAALRNPPAADTPVAILITHMSLFQEIYHLGHDRGFTEMRAFIPTESASSAALERWVAERASYCQLASSPAAQPGLRTRLRARLELSPDLYHFSVNHPQSKGMIVKHVNFACR